MMAPMDSPIHGRSTTFDNPSADKFGPPPTPSASSDVRPDGKLRRRLMRIAFGAAVYLVARWLLPGPGGRAWLTGILLLALAVFDLAMRHHAKDDDKEPYSPPTHITR
jgi:hypothetical protein